MNEISYIMYEKSFRREIGEMFTNLKVEMLKAKIDINDLSKELQLTPASIYLKINGKSQWTLKQMEITKQFLESKLNKTLNLEYLFKGA